jgi:hypothetical protein
VSKHGTQRRGAATLKIEGQGRSYDEEPALSGDPRCAHGAEIPRTKTLTESVL